MESDIKVAARIRPPIQLGHSREDVCLYALPQTSEILLANQMSFYVDYALPMDCDQSQVFDAVIQKRVDHMLQGYDVSFVAYGNANSGKTYTILGPSLHCALSETKYGILPRAAREIFNKLLTFRQHYGIQFSVSISFVEIFNEEMRDLLSTSQCNNNVNLYFKTDEKGLTTLAGVEEIVCQNVCDLFNCIRTGMNARQTARTYKNPASSLSHCVVVIKVKQKRFSNRGRTEVRSSQALFVDLAGSEQMYVMSPTGPMQTTQQTVTNAGLGVISSIIASLSGQWLPSSPFTQSLLFPILKDSFNGTMKTLLLCCLSPASADYSETLNSLRLIDHIHMLNKYTFVRDDIASSNCRNDNNVLRSDSFGLEFAASQWLKLVSNAEGLFNKLVNNDNQMPEGTREQIEEWLCLKQECEECIVTEESKTSSHQRFAGKSLERIEEVTETDTKSQSDSGNSTSSLDSDEDNVSESKCIDEQDEPEDQNEEFDEDDIFDFEDATENDDLGESSSCANKIGLPPVTLSDNLLVKLEASFTKFKNMTDELVVEQMKNNCSKQVTKEPESKKIPDQSYMSARRKSILPGEISAGLLSGLPSHIQSNAILEHEELTDLSDGDNAITNSGVEKQEVVVRGKLEKEMSLELGVGKDLEKSKSSRGFGTESENDERFKWIAEEEARLQRLQESSQKLQEQLDIKQESLEKREQFLKEKLSQEKLSQDKIANANMLLGSDRFSHLEQVLKNKSSSFEETAVDAKEVLRHEIRNLRKTKDYLMEKRRNLDSKFNKDKVLTQLEERKFIECDEAIEAIDATIEYKNEVMCGGSCELTSGEREKGEEMLLARVMKLSLMETKSLLCKYFNKVVDLRESGRKLETQIAEMDRQSAAQAWKIQELSHTLKQARLEYEKRLIAAQKDHQEKIHLLFRHYADELSSVNSGADESDRCCRQNKALKQRLQELDAIYRGGRGGGASSSSPVYRGGRGGGASSSPASHHNVPARLDETRPSENGALVACQQPSIPQHNLKRLQGSASSSSTNTKVTVFKNKLVIQKQDKDKKKQAK
ncbi:kinesin-like protein KIF7 [Nilaparvata lugens]|uniref:kinesin-like protein KIF7 n=1 Tax=Nilaparvata lugens TaxID=108931 RepID=UPI00193E2AAC|nr:kinesin-like protein KIF7 [Nilaparvata lugens]